MKKVRPPWIEYPGYPPSDTFWRQPGEIWFFYVWLPYWQSLTTDAKQQYLDRWQAPEQWLTYCIYINPEYKALLDYVDNE